MGMLRRGLSGEPVRVLQQNLGVNADGVFGQGTDAALREYQRNNGLSVDGIAGPDTFAAMGLYELVLLHRPIRGELVRRMQSALGVGADGVFGSGTEAAVKKYQKENSLEPTGEADPQMLAKLGFPEFSQDKVDASLITEATPTVDTAAVEQAKTEEPPKHEPSFIARAGNAIATVEALPINVGKSIWNTVKKIF
jgi:peptidoglycan hydrolase-like protein with peptidoglycan-binding domain